MQSTIKRSYKKILTAKVIDICHELVNHASAYATWAARNDDVMYGCF